MNLYRASRLNDPARASATLALIAILLLLYIDHQQKLQPVLDIVRGPVLNNNTTEVPVSAPLTTNGPLLPFPVSLPPGVVPFVGTTTTTQKYIDGIPVLPSAQTTEHVDPKKDPMITQGLKPL